METAVTLDVTNARIRNETKQKILNATSDSQRCQAAYNELLKTDTFLCGNIKNDLEQRKSIVTSAKFRKQGNRELTSEPPNLAAALSLYNKSIAFAPQPANGDRTSTELALGFAGRSAVLFVMEKYEECVGDIERALAMNYLEEFKYKVFQRRGDCYRFMGMMRDAEENYKMALNFVPLSTEDKVVKKSQVDSIEEQLSVIKKAVGPVGQYEAKSRLRPPPQKSHGDNHEAPSASDCMEIAYSPEWGRYIKSTKQVKPGEVVVVEEPYASAMDPSYYSTHCYHCYKRYDAMIPCKTCHLAMFCSEKCRETSWEKSHRTECSITQALVTVFQDVILLTAFRTFITALQACNGLRRLYELVLKIDSQEQSVQHQRTKGFNDKNQLISSDYTAVYHLRIDIRKCPIDHVHSYALQAANLLYCIKNYSPVFDQRSGDVDYEFFVGGLLLRNIITVNTHAYPIIDYGMLSEKNVLPMNNKMGYGLYMTAGFFNHSCVPSVYMHSRGNMIVLISNRPIGIGEQMFYNYLGDKGKDTASRQLMLQNFFYFTCDCLACSGRIRDSPYLDDYVHRCRECLLPGQCDHATLVGSTVERLRHIHTTWSRRDRTVEIGRLIQVINDNTEMTRQQVLFYADVLKRNTAQAGIYFND